MAPVPLTGWLLLALILAAFLAGILALAASRPRIPPPFGVAVDGVSAFATEGAIYAVDLRTGIETTIITGPDHYAAPVFSPSGTRIAFFRDDGPEGNPMLMVAEADGSGQREIAGPLQQAGSYAIWSPDSTMIGVQSLVDGRSSITIARADGGDSTVIDLGLVVEDFIWRPPVGRELLVRAHDRTGAAIYSIRPDGTGMRALTPIDPDPFLSFQQPAVSPDGRTLAYAQWDETTLRVHTVDLESGEERILASGGPYEHRAGPRYAPDGSWLLVEGIDLEGPVPADGVRSLLIVPADLSSPGRRIGPQFDIAEGIEYRVSADGSTVYLRYGDEDMMWTIPVDGGPATTRAWNGEDLPEVQRLAR